MDETRCIKQVNEAGRFGWLHQHQCPRKRGYGPNGQYCKQHDPDRIKAEYDRRAKEHSEEYQKRNEQHRRTQIALALIEGIPTEEISKYILVKKEA